MSGPPRAPGQGDADAVASAAAFDAVASAAAFDATKVRFATDGLVPVVVQDLTDGRVLMLAYMDAKAVAATLGTGFVHFHSRSRDRLWLKGETSGNVLRLRSIELDCDGDALLVRAEPAGPTCHRGTRSCFDAALDRSPAPEAPRRVRGAADTSADGSRAAGPGMASPQGFVWLEALWATILERAAVRPAGSYTARLLGGGVDAVGRKVTEEATEVLLAARDDAEAERAGGSRDRTEAALAAEAADLLYHALVLLAERGMEPRGVLEVLQARHRA
jgi:phosphoribosyl-ATP pyrophosphohydrolase/phosphoribosyl-AMP cyclohydrolase